MKSIASVPLAVAAGLLSLASVASGQSFCAITCFQNVITEHPPLDCTEDNMYLCFCTIQPLQNYFLECVYEDCADEAEAAVGFGVNLCSELGAPITVPPRPATTTTTSETEPTPDPVTTTTTDEPAAPEPTTATTEGPSEPEPTPSAAESSAEGPAVPEESASESAYPVPSASDLPAGNSTVPPVSEPSHEASMANAMGVTSGLVLAAGVAAAALLL